MRKWSMLFLILASFFICIEEVQAIAPNDISARQAVVMDEKTGRIIFDKNGHERRPIASITKIMTAIIAIEQGHLQDVVTVSEEATKVDGSSIYLQQGEKMTLEDLLYGLMLRSGNDAAIAISEHIAGSVEGFTFLMNEKAVYLGMENTHFTNPHGLHEDEHYSSAYDMALLTRYAMQNDVFRKISSEKEYMAKKRKYLWLNKNKLLTHLYPATTGGKTGFTKKAGRTLVTSAEKDDISLITVTLHASRDWDDHILLYETYFDQLTNVLLKKSGPLQVSGGNKEITANLREAVFIPLLTEEIADIHHSIVFKQDRGKEKIGSLMINLQDEAIYSVPIYRSLSFIEAWNLIWKKLVRID